MSKLPIWELLIERGFCTSKKEAESWIMMGKVLNGTLRIDKSGTPVDENAEITVKGIEQKYVNKGGIKLEGAIQDFRLDIRGLTAIDIGASTGGFTDCLVQHGAKLVYAADAGFGQLTGKLRNHPSVVNMEKTNISDDVLLSLNPTPQLASVDLSYLSLKKAIPVFADILKQNGRLICLVKPIFEIESADIRRSGIIDNAGNYRTILHDLCNFVHEKGYMIQGITNSRITGNKGTREFFLLVDLHSDFRLNDAEISVQIENAIERVMQLEIYRK